MPERGPLWRGRDLVPVVEHLDGRLPEAVYAAITTVPSDFWGLGFSIVGYAVGQALSPPSPEPAA